MRFYYHFDGLGSVAALSDSNGTAVERYSYTVFGEPNRTSDYDNPYMFTGRRFDTETSNYYYRARYYKPSIGRFLQVDPTYYSDGLNLYTYCYNNPVNRVDPYGLSFISWWKDHWKVFVEWLRTLIEVHCPPVTGIEACGEGMVTCMAYRNALNRLMEDPDFIYDDEYNRLRRIGKSPGIRIEK